MLTAREKEVLGAAVEHLRKLPGVNVAVGDELHVVQEAYVDTPDAAVVLESTTGEQKYLVEVKNVDRRTLDGVLVQLSHYSRLTDHALLLVTNRLSESLQDDLLQEGVQFVDAAGNMYLDSPAYHAVVRGQKANTMEAIDPFTPAGLKVLYALLAVPDLRRGTYRELAKVSGVGLGTVSRAVKSLLQAGHLIQGRSGVLHVSDFRNLLERWELGYLETLRPRLEPSKWRSTTTDRKTVLRSLPKDVLVGGEEAAAVLTGYLKPQTITVHGDKRRQQELQMKLKLLPAEDSADIHMLSSLEPAERYFPAGLDTEVPHAHPILVRAELLALGGDRLREVAGRLLDDVILKEESRAN